MNDTYGIVLPANYSYSRKSAYHYGWDWGPRLVTAGIWKPIYLRAFDYLTIDSVLFRNDEVTQVTPSKSVSIFGTATLNLKQAPLNKHQYRMQVIDEATSKVLYSVPFLANNASLTPT